MCVCIAHFSVCYDLFVYFFLVILRRRTLLTRLHKYLNSYICASISHSFVLCDLFEYVIVVILRRRTLFARCCKDLNISVYVYMYCYHFGDAEEECDLCLSGNVSLESLALHWFPLSLSLNHLFPPSLSLSLFGPLNLYRVAKTHRIP